MTGRCRIDAKLGSRAHLGISWSTARAQNSKTNELKEIADGDVMVFRDGGEAMKDTSPSHLYGSRLKCKREGSLPDRGWQSGAPVSSAPAQGAAAGNHLCKAEGAERGSGRGA